MLQSFWKDCLKSLSRLSSFPRLPMQVAFMAIALLTPAAASAAPKDVAYISVDVNTGKILSRYRETEKMHPASLTKMMTLYILFDVLDDNRISLNTRLKVSKNAASKPASKLYVKSGSTIRVEDAIRALAIKSANDVATVVAENLAGSEAAFALSMTNTARALGMRNTTFKNASGLHHAQQVTTAYDMYLLSVALQDRFPKYYKYFGESSFKYGSKSIRGHNPFLGSWRGVDGIKTGYTRASGYNLATNIARDRKHVVAVVLGSSSSKSRNNLMKDLLSKSIAKAKKGYRTSALRTDDIPTLIFQENTVAMLAQVDYTPKTLDITPDKRPKLFNHLPENFFYTDQDVLHMMVEHYDLRIASQNQ